MPESEKPIWKDILSLLKDILSLFIIGFGIGWLAGISISPVASIIISILLGVAISIFGITAISLTIKESGGVTKQIGLKAAEKISIGLLALVILGIVAGVNIGILMRVHETLGVEKRDESFVNMQKDLNELRSWFSETEKANNNEKIALREGQIAQRILDKYYPKGGSKSESAIPFLAQGTWASRAGLMAGEAQGACSELLSGRPISSWRDYIKTLDDKRFEGLDKITDDSKLEEKVKDLCDNLQEEY